MTAGAQRAADLGFYVPEDVAWSIAALAEAGVPGDLDLAMDLARLLDVSLPRATSIIVARRWRRYGFASRSDARRKSAGQAEAYATTYLGKLDVLEARGHTWVRPYRDFVVRLFRGG